MSDFLRFVFFQFLVRPVILVGLGLNVRHRERLPSAGPAILASNHNSHLDTMVLMTLFPWRVLRRVRPVAAGDYFLRNRLVAWFALRIIGIIPIDRGGSTAREELMAGVAQALERNEIVIIFPEGSRGEPERLQQFKSGLYFLSQAHPQAEVVPVFMHGLGKVLPRGEMLPVPFFCDVFVGESMARDADRDSFMKGFAERMTSLAAEGRFPSWD